MIVYLGLKALNDQPIEPLKLLFKNLKKEGEINIGDLIFKIAPRINAAGRMATAKIAADYLISDSESLLENLKTIESNNDERKKIDEIITKEAISQLEKQPLDRVTNLVYSKDWHKGVVGIVAPENYSLLGLISCLCPVIISGNTCVLFASESKPLCSVTLAEVLATSDVPSGVVNILTGQKTETVPHIGKHMDVNAVYLADLDSEFKESLRLDAVDNLKRIIVAKEENWGTIQSENPYIITSFMETKTTWHPIEIISASGSGY